MLYIPYVRFSFLILGIIHQATAKADHVNIPTNISHQYKTDVINFSNSIETYSLLMAGSEEKDRRGSKEQIAGYP